MNLSHFLQASAHPVLPLEDDETAAYRTLLGRWLIDLALMLGWNRAPVRRNRFDRPCCWDNDEFLIVTGLTGFQDDDSEEDIEDSAHSLSQRAKQFTARLHQRRAELATATLDPDLPLLRNLRLLGDLLNLSLAEQAILCFAVLLKGDRLFYRAIEQQSSSTTTAMLFKILAQLTGIPVPEVQASLNAMGVLMSTDLINIHADMTDLEDKISTRRELPYFLLIPHDSAEALMARFVKSSPKRTLTLANFPHLVKDTTAASSLMRAALHNKLPGSNLLLYGPPGVGKTEYAAVLAEAVGADLYEVDYADEDGDPIRGEQRLRAFNLGQRLLAGRDNALLLFDEVEDVFESDPFAELFGGGGRGRAAGGKAWINRTLENNPVPAIWITNDADSMNGAYLRRFDYSVRFSLPPQAVRLAIAQHHLGDWAGEDDWLARIAAQEHLTPAQLERAAKLARHAADDPDAPRALVLQALDRSVTLLGQKRAPARNIVPTGYDLRYLNTDQNLPKLVAALQRRPEGIFCFHGPAGTGKSELARYLADQLQKPLLVKRASDLLDKYVGETEQRIAAMFNDARQRDAVLVLDEADSFLRDRRSAQQAWEVTQVNELLTQMEAFEGIFIATTNLMESLDAASLRRFPWKIGFDWLKPAQRWALFAQELARLGGDLAEAADWKADIWALEQLTPGDFAAVVRQYELWDETPSAREFYHRLCVEVAAKRKEQGAAATETRTTGRRTTNYA